MAPLPGATDIQRPHQHHAASMWPWNHRKPAGAPLSEVASMWPRPRGRGISIPGSFTSINWALQCGHGRAAVESW